jgi:transcriptional regulator with XRE-family HTH domain
MKQQTMSDVLRNAIRKSDASQYDIERATGVKRASIIRFLRGDTSLRLDKADALAVFLGLTLRPVRERT